MLGAAHRSRHGDATTTLNQYHHRCRRHVAGIHIVGVENVGQSKTSTGLSPTSSIPGRPSRETCCSTPLDHQLTRPNTPTFGWPPASAAVTMVRHFVYEGCSRISGDVSWPRCHAHDVRCTCVSVSARALCIFRAMRKSASPRGTNFGVPAVWRWRPGPSTNEHHLHRAVPQPTQTATLTTFTATPTATLHCHVDAHRDRHLDAGRRPPPVPGAAGCDSDGDGRRTTTRRAPLPQPRMRRTRTPIPITTALRTNESPFGSDPCKFDRTTTCAATGRKCTVPARRRPAEPLDDYTVPVPALRSG